MAHRSNGIDVVRVRQSVHCQTNLILSNTDRKCRFKVKSILPVTKRHGCERCEKQTDANENQ